jgi:hypothetical protein
MINPLQTGFILNNLQGMPPVVLTYVNGLFIRHKGCCVVMDKQTINVLLRVPGKRAYAEVVARRYLRNTQQYCRRCYSAFPT